MIKFFKKTLLIILFIMSGIIFPAAFDSLPTLAGAETNTGDFPAEISGTMKYVYSGHDNSGCWNVPKCADRDWTIDLNLQFKLVKVNGNEAQYKASGGGWQASGEGHGILREDFDDVPSTVTVTSKYSGSGTFTPNGKDDATLTYFRSDHSFFITFFIQSGLNEMEIKYTSKGKNSRGTYPILYIGDSSGKATLNDGQLTFNPDKPRKWTNPNFPSQYEGGFSGTLVGSGLKADFACTPQTRGEVTLDGSKSTGNIQKYTWSFTAPAGQEMPEGVHFNGDAQLEGQTVKVILLAPVEVTLTITDDKGVTNSKKILIPIQARTWKTPCKHEPDNIGIFEWQVLKSTKGVPPEFRYGLNTCALCEKILDKGSVYHPDGEGAGSNRTFENTGYTLSKIDVGPFAGTFYVKEYKIKTERRPLLNANFISISPFYKLNMKYKTDILTFIQMTLEHEAIHTVLLREALKEHDPAKDMEQLFNEDFDQLKKNADSLLRSKETDLIKKFGDDNEVLRRLYEKYKNRQGVLAFENLEDPEHPIVFIKFYYFNLKQNL